MWNSSEIETPVATMSSLLLLKLQARGWLHKLAAQQRVSDEYKRDDIGGGD